MAPSTAKEVEGTKEDSPKKKSVKWRYSAAREILQEDFFTEGGFLFKNALSVEDAFDFYNQKYPHFFSQIPWEQFKNNYKRYEKQCNERNIRSFKEDIYLKHDRKINPTKTHNAKGEPKFDLHPAKPLLIEDIKNKLHERMTPSELRKTRPEYQAFVNKIFKERIYQIVRTQKYYNYREDKRTEKRRKEAKSSPISSDYATTTMQRMSVADKDGESG